MGDCNDCTYSSVGRFSGVIRLYCGLCGQPLEGLREGCERSKGLESMTRENWYSWIEWEAQPRGVAVSRRR